MIRAYGVESLATSDLDAYVQRARVNGSLLTEYNSNMKAQSPVWRRCDTADCWAKLLCTMKWWSSNGEYLACVDSQAFAAADDDSQPDHASVGATPAPSTALPSDVSSSDVLITVGTTLVATLIAVGCVVGIQHALRRHEVFRARDERASQYDNVFPML